MTARPKPVAGLSPAAPNSPHPGRIMPGSRAAQADPRWPLITAALAALRHQRRYAVRIVDADCACGTLLIEAVRHARALGFTAIEGRGIDGSPAMIRRARAAAAKIDDPAIGLEFAVADMVTALAAEAEVPADILLWRDHRRDDWHPGVGMVLAAAGDRVIGDPVASVAQTPAA